jgi:regulatory protein
MFAIGAEKPPGTSLALLPCLSESYASCVRTSAPRKLSTEIQLYTSAVRALMRRAHSIHEMKEYLSRRAENPEMITPVIQKLKEQQFLDDARYARDYARIHAQGRRQGKFRIARELRARGVPDRYIEAALDSIFAETDEAALIHARLVRKLKNVRSGLAQKKLASLYRSLLRAGFSSDAIRAELRAATRADLAEVPDPSLDDA